MVKKYIIEKDVTEATIFVLIVLLPTFTARTARGWILFTNPLLMSFIIISSLMTLIEPVVEAEHPPTIMRDMSTKIEGDGHRV